MPKSALRKDSKRETLTLQAKSHVMYASFPELEGTARWLTIMKQFTQAKQEVCSMERTKVLENQKTFPTGSSYDGDWKNRSMSGQGIYTFPENGVVYKGQFENGEFHGEGELRYDTGEILKADWENGKITSSTLFFSDGIAYDEHDWKYCVQPDRRFNIEIDGSIQPAGQSYLTADQPTKDIPDGCYDCVNGIYDPLSKTIYDYNGLGHMIGTPVLKERSWILSNCRTKPDLPKGPCRFLYDKWLTPTFEAETPQKPPVQTKAQLEKEASELFGFTSRSTSRLCLEKNKRLSSLHVSGAINDFYTPPNARNSHSDQLLAGVPRKSDEITYQSIQSLLKKKKIKSSGKQFDASKCNKYA